MLRNDTMLYTTLLAKTSHKAITVLNFQSDNSKIPAISESGSDACSFSSSCIFHLCSMSYNLLFKAGHDRWAKNKQTKKNPPVNKALVIWQQQFIGSGCGGWRRKKKRSPVSLPVNFFLLVPENVSWAGLDGLESGG